jgi:sensor histidine kinase YesM
LKITLKNSYSGRNFFILGIVFIILTVISTYILSGLITEVSEKSNAESTKHSFIKRQEVIAQEFSRLLLNQKEIERVIEVSSPEKLSDNLKVVIAIHAGDSIIKNNWFQIDSKNIEFTALENDQSSKVDLKAFIDAIGNKTAFNSIVNTNKVFLWRIYFKTSAANGTIVKYGYDVDLQSLQSYFYTVDQNEFNYAFVFDKDGTVLYHPEAKFLQQNIFKITNLSRRDTTFQNADSFSKKIALSEYLKLDIVRYTKRLNIKGTHWYVSANFPKEIVKEDVNLIKKYASSIYFITTGILIVFFYLFTIFSRRNFREKEVLIEDRNKLLVENEIIHKEKALIQLQQLKEQINPHFLFNSLNSLYMLIDSNTDIARKFTLNLSKIYRYLINPPIQNIVTLKEELLFIEKYIFLQQTRFTTEFVFTITIEDESALAKKVPYLAFQISIENAIKHTIASEEHPLKIAITIKEKEVIISNNLNEKQNSYQQSKFGHKYLDSIYKYYSNKGFKTYKEDGYYICVLPLI